MSPIVSAFRLTGQMAPSCLRRWFRFNVVGLAGVAVQLGCLAVLVRGAGMHYLGATLLAVEAAVIHNFAWHQQWTWRDRPAGSRRAVAVRFARFQALNGAISLAVNAGAMVALAGLAGIDPLAAGLGAIAAASLVNFLASDRIVFDRAPAATRRRSDATRYRRRAVIMLVAALTPAAAAAQPEPAAAAAWTRYQGHLDARYRAAVAPGTTFFALDQAGALGAWRRQVVEGGIVTHEVDGPDMDGARIHHWIGAVFVPGTTVSALVKELQEGAGAEARLYEDVVDSRLLSRDGDRLRVYMRLRRTTILTATFDTEHDVEYRRMGKERASSRSVAVRIAELADAGTPRERERAAGDDRGFLWRLVAYWRFEQAGDGVIVECESVSLSRSVPTLLRPVANPIVTRVAREALQSTLEQLKQSFTPASRIR